MENLLLSELANLLKKLIYSLFLSNMLFEIGDLSANHSRYDIAHAYMMAGGIPFYLNFFDKAQNAFIAAYRKYGKDNKFTIQIEYISSPKVEGKTLILADTMLATGSSLVLAYNKLCELGEPAHTHIVCPIASEYSLGYLSKQLPHKKVTLWVAAVDEELTNKSYIVPGLGDAGDLAFGSKL